MPLLKAVMSNQTKKTDYGDLFVCECGVIAGSVSQICEEITMQKCCFFKSKCQSTLTGHITGHRVTQLTTSTKTQVGEQSLQENMCSQTDVQSRLRHENKVTRPKQDITMGIRRPELMCERGSLT